MAAQSGYQIQEALLEVTDVYICHSTATTATIPTSAASTTAVTGGLWWWSSWWYDDDDDDDDVCYLFLLGGWTIDRPNN